MKKFFLPVILIASSLISNAQNKIHKGPLDKEKFSADINEDGKKKPFGTDDLSFNMGKFKSVLYLDWGFDKANTYEVTSIDSTSTQGVKIYSWTSDLENDKGEKLSWSGTITNDEIEGTIDLVNKKGKTEKSFTFSGKMKKKPGQK